MKKRQSENAKSKCLNEASFCIHDRAQIFKRRQIDSRNKFKATTKIRSKENSEIKTHDTNEN